MDIIYAEESYQIIGICMEVHNNLGSGFAEIVYKDALKYEFQQNDIPYEREKRYDVNYKEVLLKHHFFADFVVFDKIILGVKGVKAITDDFVSFCINYLCVSKSKLALLVNFGEAKLKYKRIVY